MKNGKRKTTEVKKKKQIESRKWFITINNYSETDIIRAKNEIKKCTYGIFGREIGPDNGLPHVHIWLHYKSTRKWGKFSGEEDSLWPRANVQLGEGRDCDQVYLKKDNDFQEFGIMEKQGKRSDLIEIKECVETGGNMKDILEIASNYQAIKMGELLLKYKEKKRDYKIRDEFKVIWHYGKTGLGKTESIYEKHGIDAIFEPTTYKWWEGYDGDEIVLLDDFRPGWCSYKNLLKLCDVYPFRVQTKGGTRQVKYKTLYITSHLSPRDYYSELDDDDYDQLKRRITTLIEFK